MRAKLDIIQQNYKVIEKINVNVWAKRSKHKRVLKHHSSVNKIPVLIQLLVGIVGRK